MRRPTERRLAGTGAGSLGPTIRAPSSRAGAPDDAAASPRAAGVVAPRRSVLLGGRALLGGLLIAVAAVLVFAAAGTGRSGRTGYAVADRPLPAGAALTSADLVTQPLSLSGGVAASSFRNSAALIGRTLAVPVASGELVESSMLAPIGHASATRPVSVAVDPTSLTGLAPGVPVDVLAVPSSGSSSASASGGAGPSVTVILRNVTLLGLDRGSSGLISGLSSTDASGATVATLGVGSLTDAEALVGAAHDSTLVLVAAEPGDVAKPSGG